MGAFSPCIGSGRWSAIPLWRARCRPPCGDPSCRVYRRAPPSSCIEQDGRGVTRRGHIEVPAVTLVLNRRMLQRMSGRRDSPRGVSDTMPDGHAAPAGPQTPLESLTAERDKALAMVAAREDILQVVAHDLRNPLNLVKVGGSLLR